MTATYTPSYRSPIRGGPTGDNDRFALADLSGAPVVLVQGGVADLLQARFAGAPLRPGDMIRLDEGYLARLTAMQFYLFGATASANLLTAATLDAAFRQAGRFAHATDYSGGTAILRLVGRAVPEVLSKLCGLDFHTDRFPKLHVAQTSVAKIKTLIARHDEGTMPGYSLHIDAPSGQYLWDTVLDAGREFL
jgi:heterotetrameric sarcosine oxidase gamma subunit